MWMFSSQEQVARRAGFGEKPHPLTTPECCFSRATSCPLQPPARCQTLAVPSEEAVATCDPSCEKAQVQTTLLCPARRLTDPGPGTLAIQRGHFLRVLKRISRSYMIRFSLASLKTGSTLACSVILCPRVWLLTHQKVDPLPKKDRAKSMMLVSCCWRS